MQIHNPRPQGERRYFHSLFQATPLNIYSLVPVKGLSLRGWRCPLLTLTFPKTSMAQHNVLVFRPAPVNSSSFSSDSDKSSALFSSKPQWESSLTILVGLPCVFKAGMVFASVLKFISKFIKVWKLWGAEFALFYCGIRYCFWPRLILKMGRIINAKTLKTIPPWVQGFHHRCWSACWRCLVLDLFSSSPVGLSVPILAGLRRRRVGWSNWCDRERWKQMSYQECLVLVPHKDS